MKKSIIGILLCILLIPILTSAQQVTSVTDECLSLDKSYHNKITFIHKDKVMGVMTLPQFQELVKSAERDVAIKDAENNGRVEVKLKDSPWDLDPESDFNTKATIIWYNTERQVLKRMVIDINLSHDPDNRSWTIDLLRIYDQVARYGFPTALVVIVIILLL